MSEEWISLDRHPDRQTKDLLGRRVRLTKHGIEMGLQGRARTIYGRVTRVWGLSGDYVEVKRDGIKTSASYAASFWEARDELPAPPAPGAPERDGDNAHSVQAKDGER